MHIITDALPILPADMVTQAVEAALAEEWRYHFASGHPAKCPSPCNYSRPRDWRAGRA